MHSNSKNDHARLIRELGGPTHVANWLGLDSIQRVWNWTVRGVPYRQRARVATLARFRSVRLPDDWET